MFEIAYILWSRYQVSKFNTGGDVDLSVPILIESNVMVQAPGYFVSRLKSYSL